jgi:ribosome-associated protein
MTADSLTPVKWLVATVVIVAPMDDLLVAPGVTVPAAELSWRFDTSGGPGGQHANKSSTRVELSLDLAASAAFDEVLLARVLDNLGSQVRAGVLTIQVGESRSQWRNRQIARQRMAATLRQAMRPPQPRRRPTKPGRAARERRLSAKRARAETKRLRRRPVNPD